MGDGEGVATVGLERVSEHRQCVWGGRRGGFDGKSELAGEGVDRAAGRWHGPEETRHPHRGALPATGLRPLRFRG
jgi:hypothetical protein